MDVGDSFIVSHGHSQKESNRIRSYIHSYSRKLQLDMKFIVRKTDDGKTRVWRKS